MAITINGNGTITGISNGALSADVLTDSTIGTGKLTTAAQNSLKTLAFFNMWRVTQDMNAGTDATVTDWEQVTGDGYGGLGGSLTVSSGIFTFPSTGIYLIQGAFRILTGNQDGTVNVILYTTQNNSSYSAAAYTSGGNSTSLSTNTNQTSVSAFIFDVTDTSTHKFKYESESMGSESYIHGSTTSNQSWFTVIKLSET